jgi:hypothetical protein
MALPGVAKEALCWSCKLKLENPSSFFCGHCGIKQVGFEAGVGFLEENVEEGEEPEEPIDPIQRGEHEEVLGFPDTLLTYVRVFHPRPRRLADGKLWEKGFLKRYHPREHDKLNMNHGDVRHWFSDLEDPFVAEFFKHPSIRHDTSMMRRFAEFVETREPELASLVFVNEGMTLHWKIDDILRYTIEIKHHRRKQMKGLKFGLLNKCIKKHPTTSTIGIQQICKGQLQQEHQITKKGCVQR